MVALEHQLTGTASQPIPDAIPAALRRGGGSPRRVLVISLVATAVLALFASRDLASWAERLGGRPLAEATQSVAAGWDQAMAALGLVRPHEELRSAVSRFLDCQWDNCR